MRRIELASLVLEDFRSFRYRTEIAFEPDGGLKYITGHNEVEPRLGANGVGKTTLWDALKWCLFSTSTRDLKAADLANWSDSTARPYVCATLIVAGVEWKVERHGSPNAFSVNGKATEQTSFEADLGLNAARFMQSVLFGQQVRLFADLTVPERGTLFDAIMDLGIWLSAGDAASKALTALQREDTRLSNAISFARGKLSGLAKPEDLAAKRDAWAAANQEAFAGTLSDLEAAEEALAQAEEALAAFNADSPSTKLDYGLAAHTDAIRAAEQARANLAQARRDLTDTEKRIGFYRNTATCSECGQPITAAHKHAESVKLDARATTLDWSAQELERELTIRLHCAEQARLAQDTARRQQMVHTERKAHLNSTCVIYQQNVHQLEEHAKRLGDATNPYETEIEALGQQRATLTLELRGLVRDQRVTQEAIVRAEFWRAGFKRVRLFEVRQTLAWLQIEVANALSFLGLSAWRVQFTTEMETKTGTIKPGIHIQIRAPGVSRQVPWEAWSGGEGQRLRLAIALGLSSLIQQRAGVDFGFEAWDEPTQWLSDIGQEDLLACLQHRASITGKAIWLCDHRAFANSAFSEVLMITKTQTGSHVERVYKDNR